MAEFTITKSTLDDIAIVSLHGFLDAHTASQFEQTLGEVINQGMHKIIVNFAELEYISSAGLGVFMVFIEGVRAKNGDIKLAEMQPRVFTVFDLLGFPMLFEIYEQQQDAIAKFGSNA